MILNHPNISDYDFGFVRGIIMSTSPVSMKLYENTKKVFYNAGVSVGYGLTEIGPVFGKHPGGMTEPPLTCGYPQKGVDYKLVDGVLHVKSASMSKGYDNTDTTKIVDGWLNTGDLFRIDENGFYFFMGRADDMYKVGGEQVYPSEIESSLERINGVEQACVIMLEDDIKGHKPYAFCTGSFDKDTVTTELLTMLPRFKIPRNIWWIDSFPLIGVGKIDRRALTNKAKEML
jgi:acyl-CoA synthetase (AMP-forming)/AMP-acid ligase II